MRGHVVHTNGGHRNHGDASQRQHLNVFAHVLGLTGEGHNDDHIILGHIVHGAFELITCRDDLAELTANLHGLGKFLHGVALSVAGTEAVHSASLMDALEQSAQFHVLEVVVGALNIFAAALNEPRVEGFAAVQRGLDEVLQLSKSGEVQLLRQADN